MTREEFKNAAKRFFRQAGAEVTEGHWCKQFCCNDDCPFRSDKFCPSNERVVDRMFNTFEYVEQWAKDHPTVTMRDKYKEVFGVEPKDKYGDFVCPHSVGFDNVECVRGDGYNDCVVCKDKFWNSEYIESKKEGES